MLALDPIPGRRWLDCQQLGEHYDYEPRGNCHEPITASLAALGLGEAAGGAAATTALGALGGAGETALLASAGLETGVAAGFPAAFTGTSAYAAGAGGGLSTLATVGQVAGVGGSLLQAGAGAQNSAYQAAVARAEAAAQKQKANEDAAAAQRVQITRLRQTELAQSRVRAVAASSGTDATSPDIVNTEGLIGQQGQYNALSALYEGQQRARTDNYQASIDLFKAKQIDAGIFPAAAGTLLSGLGSFADRRLNRNYLLNQSY